MRDTPPHPVTSPPASRPERPSTGQASIYDVARVAGVSHQTVWRVLTHRGHAAPTTEARVRSAADALGYRRNVAAGVLARGRSSDVAVVVDEQPDPAQIAALVRIAGQASERGDAMIVEVVSAHGTGGERAVRNRLAARGITEIHMLARGGFVTETLS